MLMLALVQTAPAGSASGKNYYVATTGDDANNGTSISKPFKTIQKAASIATAGNTVYIRAGTYRETVTPSNSGSSGSVIRFTNYNSETVTVSGADAITGAWTVCSGNIYKIDVGSRDFDQLFVDGKMNLKAQWPNNTALDLLSKSWMATIAGGDSTSIYDSSIPGPNWNGGMIWILPGKHWVAFQRSITAYDGKQQKASFATTGGSHYEPKAGDRYFLFNKLEVLDAGGEWYLDKGTHELYLWATANDNPANHTVEAKNRNLALDLSNKNYIEFDGVNFLAGNVKMTGSTYCAVKNGSLKYPDYFENANGYALQDCGIVVSGNHNKIDHMEIAYTPGAGIYLSGIANEITCCTIHDINWTGGEYGAITYGLAAWSKNLANAMPPIGTQKDLVISHNTIYKTGRSGMLGHFTEAATITYNEIYNVGVICFDLGCIYIDHDGGYGGSDSVFAYNKIHDNNGTGSGIYFDACTPYLQGGGTNGSYCGQNYKIHHNEVYNITPWAAFHVNGGDPKLPVKNLRFYNNSTYNCSSTLRSGRSSAGTDCSGVTLKNNIGTAPWKIDSQITDISNNFTSGDPKFVDPIHYDFHLQSNSPCIDAGCVVSGITDGYSGSAPDQGRYEF
ncbi:MAG: DUF1565 domain-containing protein [Verrucomicrobia bacterium]|nr:DUF1565 domain-containing protein [Verrucomicrobiota bacterium]MBU1734390.1 DUF1565 domain-containing protein [Verrucomicrobiota bacterium]MBU1856110.1 DUF1565 domain-containing protein [Verrucomicrobiota bacterium]